MINDNDYVRLSLELNLFFMRIAKEHSIFLEAGFTERDISYMEQSEMFKNAFSQLLMETIILSDGIISQDAANSGELVTDLTREAERETQFYTNIKIDPEITRMEEQLSGTAPKQITMNTVMDVEDLNKRAIIAVEQLAIFKSNILNNLLTCKMFANNYPLLVDHILREAKFYLRLLKKLQSREDFDLVKEAAFQETFWNRIMAEHSKFIRGLLDPTEVNLFNTANDFGKKFDELTAEAMNLSNNLSLLPSVTQKSLNNTIDIRNFKKQGTEGIIECKVRSIALPLLGDHVVREANHYIRILKDFKNEKME